MDDCEPGRSNLEAPRCRRAGQKPAPFERRPTAAIDWLAREPGAEATATGNPFIRSSSAVDPRRGIATTRFSQTSKLPNKRRFRICDPSRKCRKITEIPRRTRRSAAAYAGQRERMPPRPGQPRPSAKDS